MFGSGGDFFAPVFLFLLHFFVVRDIAWIGHAPILRGCRSLRWWDNTPKRLTYFEARPLRIALRELLPDCDGMMRVHS